MDGEDYRTGSADSENGSDNSYVQVSKEDAQHVEPLDTGHLNDSPELVSGTGMSTEDYTLEEGDSATTRQEAAQSTPPPAEDPFYMESHDPEEEVKATSSKDSPPMKSSGVEDVGPLQSGPVSSTELTVPKATGYLSFLNTLPPLVLYLIYWQDIKLSAVVLGVDLIVLLTLSLNTFLHTLVLLLLSFMVVSLTYIVTKIAIDSFYNRNIRNPFSDHLNQKICLPEEKIMEWTQYFVQKLSRFFNVLVRLLLFDNIKRSFKFGIGLWLASFVTNCLDILTALYCVVILLFAVPPIYSRHQQQIDRAIKQAICQTCEVFQMVKSRVPYLGKKKVE